MAGLSGINHREEEVAAPDPRHNPQGLILSGNFRTSVGLETRMEITLEVPPRRLPPALRGRLVAWDGSCRAQGLGRTSQAQFSCLYNGKVTLCHQVMVKMEGARLVRAAAPPWLLSLSWGSRESSTARPSSPENCVLRHAGMHVWDMKG